MTPLALELEGFTCYRQRTRVDWGAADTALFAVTGPTGAGKSTLLDAITYVLYGKTERLGSRGLASLISPGAESLLAQLTFRTSRGVFRVTRTAQRRAASVGTEVRIEVADENEKDGWRQLSDSERVKDANQALEEIVGLDYDGFTRAVLLPQGAFDEFLRGDAALRRQLLARLLGLDKVETIQRLANSKASGFKAEAEARRTLLATEYAGVTPAAVSALKERVAELEEGVGAEARCVTALEADLAVASKHAELLAERARLATERERLRKEAPAMGELREQLGRGRRAEGALPLLNQLEVARERVEKARADEALRRQELEAAEEALERSATAAEGVAAEVTERLAAIGRATDALRAAEPGFRALTERGGSLALAARSERAEPLDEGRWNALQTALSLVAPFERALRAERGAAATLEQERRLVAELEPSVERLTAELERRKEAGAKLRTAAEEAERRLEDARRADMAAALRAGLEEGDPCPVCGHALVGRHAEEEHTHGEADIAAAERSARAAKTAVDGAVEEYQERRAELVKAQSRLENLADRLKRAETAWSAATQAVSEAVADLETQGADPGDPGEWTHPESVPADLRAGLRSKLDAALAAHALSVADGLTEAGVEVAEGVDLGARAAALEREAEAAKERVRLAEEERQRAAAEVESARLRLSSASETLALRLSDAEAAEEALAEAVKAAGFADAAEARAAALPPERLQALEAKLKLFDQEVERVDARDVELAADLAARPPLPKPPAELGAAGELGATELAAGLAQLLAARSQALRAKEQELGGAKNELATLRRQLERSVELRRELTEFEEKYELHHQLNLDLHGHRFPEHLLTKVQQLLARRASAILQLVTDGRYDLRLDDGDYLVADEWAGGELRSARTLSGGESFVASLALALALSDTLAGNAALGALFLDEGFGTLDRATLEAVTGVLESLTVEGRMVGVITHVPELSARLPARLVVTKGPGGSQVAWDT